MNSIKQRVETEKKYKIMKQDAEWFRLRSILGYDWAYFYFLLGGREAGKSYAVTEFYVSQFFKYGRPFYWIRLTENQANKLLTNNAEKLVDPDIRRKYNLDLFTKGDIVYNIEKRSKPDKDGKTRILKKTMMARVLALSTFYNDKGSGLFDKDFLNDPKMYYNIALDEFQREKNEKKTFDILYAFTNQLENLVRSTKTRVRVFCIGNTLEEASDLLCAFNFIPEAFGRYSLKRKRCVIDYIEPSEAYLARRKGTIADILMPQASTFTNKIKTDGALIVKKKRNLKPHYVIKFSKDTSDWFTLWGDNIVSKYKKENKTVIAMIPYIDEIFNTKQRDTIFELFNARALKFSDLITFRKFQTNLYLLKPR